MTTDQTTALNNAKELILSHRAQAKEQKYLEADDQVYFDASKVSDEGIRTRILMERAIVRHLIRSVLARTDAEYSLSVFDGEAWPIIRSRDTAAIMAEIGACDEERLRILRGTPAEALGSGSVFLVYGNDGWDVIADNTDTPEMAELLKGTEEFADHLCDAQFALDH